jgi:predicted dehydrogenase
MTSPLPTSRRDFLAASGLGLAALPLSAAAGAAKNTDASLRVGLIGTGDRGKAHLRAIAQIEELRVTALCDIDKGRLAQGVKVVESHKPRTFADYRKLLDCKELDAVFIATPCFLHKEMAVAALETGRHCYCEKPIALSVADLDALAKTVKEANRVFQVGLQLRYGAPWATTVRAIRKGDIGKPVLIRAHRYNVQDIAAHKKWFFKRAESGDIIVEQAVHELDLFNWVFGKLPTKASGFGGRAVLSRPQRDIMDHYTLSLEYGPNQRVCYSHCWFGSATDPHSGRQELVFGDRKMADLETAKIHDRFTKETTLVGKERRQDPTRAAIKDFLRCIREKKEPLANIEVGRNCVLTALLGRKAVDEGRVVTMKEILRG